MEELVNQSSSSSSRTRKGYGYGGWGVGRLTSVIESEIECVSGGRDNRGHVLALFFSCSRRSFQVKPHSSSSSGEIYGPRNASGKKIIYTRGKGNRHKHSSY